MAGYDQQHEHNTISNQVRPNISLVLPSSKG
jgi:hypothetical protein